MSGKASEARIVWDEQDPENIGWAYYVTVNGREESGPLDSQDPDAGVTKLAGEISHYGVPTAAKKWSGICGGWHWRREPVKRRAKVVACQCGEADGSVACAWSGPVTETVVVEYMPQHLRASHAAAGNSGVYPVNGAMLLRVHRDCVQWLCAEYDSDSDDWLPAAASDWVRVRSQGGEPCPE